MNILLTGATGYIGSAVLASLIAAGHDVTAIVRSADAADTASAAGATAVIGDATDVAWLTSHLRVADAAIHTAAPAEGAEAFDRAIAAAVVDAFGGTSKPYVHTGGIWAYGNNAAITEESPRHAPPLVAWRAGVEASLLEADVAASVIEPAVVYGHDAGLLTLLTSGPRSADGAIELIGDGTQHWTSVHVDDLAELYRLVLEQGSGVGYVIGASGVNPTIAELGTALAEGAGVVASTTEAAHARFGTAFADALLLDQQASGAKARSLGWEPVQPSALG